MKKIFLGFALVLFVITINAQENENSNDNQSEFKTVFGGKTIGGYGGIGIGYSLIDNRSAVTLTARGGVILGHWLALGIGGSGFINDPEYNIALNKDVSLVGGYGGFFIEPIIFPKSIVHVSFPILVGIGGTDLTSFDNSGNYDNQDSYVENSETFFVIEPAAELEFNFTKCFRMAINISYRYTSNLNWDETSSGALNSFSSGIIFKFGKF
jgi:hypothetical protein